ncbi:hypothetical protein HPB50_003277 [Hyalomma asiaticum]|uniref:Uncharacterized protein n=1 Tax=Hyalomma asiaticum TaxID=266040 RepID=A0ACB7RY17_HYAAI|nr:hypothetical protein HPB50_003277 [Hyalomma asiaticum]
MSRVRTINSTTLSTEQCQPPKLVTAERISLFDWLRIFLGHVCFCAIGLSGILIFPALVLSRRVQEMFFAFIYLFIQRLWYEDYGSVRRVVMAGLDDVVSHDATLRARGLVRVLEVGAAYGPNMPYIRRGIEYWRLEPNISFDEEFHKNLAANSKVRSLLGRFRTYVFLSPALLAGRTAAGEERFLELGAHVPTPPVIPDSYTLRDVE